ncbi:MAG: flavin-containing monooxygenase [Prochlorotrichaceae cyanobacterium]|jgi:dimethylaniline monooxygenase (N-oxide forming)
MKVCVIGAGAAGLVTAKELQEVGIEIEVLEKRDNLGGLWYLDEKGSSVSEKTSATSSKTFLQFSDFPFDREEDLFPHHSHYINYLKRYTAAHDLDRSIHYNCEVLEVTKEGDSWRVKATEKGQPYEKVFDGLAICSGLHHIPTMPKFEGFENFEGEVIHSAFLKNSTDLVGKKVVVVGGGESAADFVHELSTIADKVTMSLRRGLALTRHWSPYGLPGDYDSTRAKVWLPRPYLHDYNVSCRSEEVYSGFKTIYALLGLPILLGMLTISYQRALQLIKALFSWQSWNALFQEVPRFGPACGVTLAQECRELCKEPPQSEAEVEKRVWKLKTLMDWYSGTMHNSQPFTKRIAFVEDIVRGNAHLLPGIVGCKGGKQVEFADGTVDEVDVVLLCTGFQSTLPFFSMIPQLDGRNLYKNVFVPTEKNLGFIGYVRPNVGSLPAVTEMQARWFAGVLAGKLSLPSVEVMQKSVMEDSETYTRDRPHHVNRHTSLVDYHIYMEQLAGFVGCRPQLWRYWNQPQLLYKLLFGPMGCFQYRLHGYGANPEAAYTALERIPPLPNDRVLLHTILYFILKPWFWLLSGFGFKRFRPVF